MLTMVISLRLNRLNYLQEYQLCEACVAKIIKYLIFIIFCISTFSYIFFFLNCYVLGISFGPLCNIQCVWCIIFKSLLQHVLFSIFINTQNYGWAFSFSFFYVCALFRSLPYPTLASSHFLIMHLIIIKYLIWWL